ncbi:type II secretion system major pseudopilin GspG [Porticoccaceae bacterium]|nr:type II secretion system major pseudopilin GspG [Porticoccaceae bacterium]
MKPQPIKGLNQRGFTLMELLIVLLILGMLASIAAPQAVKYLGRAKTDTAQLQIEALSMNLDFYKIDVGEYPAEQSGLKALLEKPEGANNWLGPYVKKASSLIDPWGRAYDYKHPGEHGDFDLISLGADKKPGGEGDDKDVSNSE